MEVVYKTKDTQGVEHTGSVEAVDAHSAVLILRKKSLIIISLSPKGSSTNKFLDQILNKVSFTDLVVMTRQVVTMVSSGLVLSEAMDIVEK